MSIGVDDDVGSEMTTSEDTPSRRSIQRVMNLETSDTQVEPIHHFTPEPYSLRSLGLQT